MSRLDSGRHAIRIWKFFVQSEDVRERVMVMQPRSYRRRPIASPQPADARRLVGGSSPPQQRRACTSQMCRRQPNLAVEQRFATCSGPSLSSRTAPSTGKFSPTDSALRRLRATGPCSLRAYLDSLQLPPPIALASRQRLASVVRECLHNRAALSFAIRRSGELDLCRPEDRLLVKEVRAIALGPPFGGAHQRSAPEDIGSYRQ